MPKDNEILEDKSSTSMRNDTILQVSAALKIPPFWSNRPDLWFLQVETQFRLRGITTSQTKYDYLISSLPPDSMEIVADFLINPSADVDKYEAIKKLLITRCQDTEERRLDALLNKIELGDLKPSELFRQMETLAGGNSLVNKSLLNKLWLNKLPQAIQSCVIAIEGTHKQEEIFKIADRIFDCSDRPKVSSVQSNSQKELKDLIVDLSNRIKNLEARQSDRSRSRNNNYNNRSRSRPRKNDELCWYHSRFASKATKCLPGCKFQNNNHSLVGSNSKN